MDQKLLLTVALAAGLTACGSHGVLPSGPVGSAPFAAPASVPDGASAAIGTGVLVDHDSGKALAGVPVGLAPWEVGAKPVPQGVTRKDGTFTVHAPAPGRYLLYIGADQGQRPYAVYSSDFRPTIHDAIVLNAGLNKLVAPTMPRIPHVHRPPIESSGKFRLLVLNDMERACIDLDNSLREQHHFKTRVVTDEWLTEDEYAIWLKESRTNVGGGIPDAVSNYWHGEGNRTNCDDLVPADWVLNDIEASRTVVWYSGNAGGKYSVADELVMLDPRGALPAPTPSKAWP